MFGNGRLLLRTNWDKRKMVLRDWKPTRQTAIMALAGAAMLTLAGCQDYAGVPKHMRPLSSDTKLTLEKKGMETDAPILLRLYKQESELEVWKQQKQTGKFALLKTYDICKWSGDLGPKFLEGDRQAPEGFYTITPGLMNPNSSYYLSFNLGFPNAFDKANGRTGSFLMVHGACSSRGCYSMSDEHIQDIYSVARLAFEGGQRSFQVQALPFRMTPANMAANRNSPHIEFWRMLKEGVDHFEVTGLPPKIDVCSKRYVFNAVPQEGAEFNPTAQCPEMSVPDPIRLAVAERQIRDDTKTEKLIARLEAKENRNGPLNGLFGNTAVASAEPAPQAAQQSGPQSSPTGLVTVAEQSPAAEAVPVPEARPEPDNDLATAYTEKNEARTGFISGLMKRLW